MIALNGWTLFEQYKRKALMLFSHVAVGSNDIEKSKKFYDALFRVIGGEVLSDPKGRLMYIKDGQLLLVTKPIDGKAATCGNGITIGFSLNSPEQVNQWHKAGVDHGGKTIEDPPGVREAGGKKMYLAYLRDPDGTKLCGYYSME